MIIVLCPASDAGVTRHTCYLSTSEGEEKVLEFEVISNYVLVGGQPEPSETQSQKPTLKGAPYIILSSGCTNVYCKRGMSTRNRLYSHKKRLDTVNS